MAIAVAGFAFEAGDTDITIPVPSGAAEGDLLIAVNASDWGVAEDNEISGAFTELSTASYDAGGNDLHMHIGYRIVGANEPASHSFSVGGGSDNVAGLILITGAAASPTIVEGTPDDSMTAGSITPSGPSLLLTFHMGEQAGGGTADDFIAPNGMSIVGGAQSGSWTALGVASLVPLQAASGNRTADWNGFSEDKAASVAIAIPQMADQGVGSFSGSYAFGPGTFSGLTPTVGFGSFTGAYSWGPGSFRGSNPHYGSFTGSYSWGAGTFKGASGTVEPTAVDEGGGETEIVGPPLGAMPGGWEDPNGPADTREWDITLGGLGFNLAISKDRPYERATAQFKKDQLDTTREVGDQSLVGFWTRAQNSFHHGAGIKYFEPSQGEAVENRYNESSGVEVFEPGAVTLCPDEATLDIGTVDTLQFAEVHQADDLVLFLNDDTLTMVDASGDSTYTPTVGSAASACTHPTDDVIFVSTTTPATSAVESYDGSTSTVIWKHDTVFDTIFFAKARLFGIDRDGNLYQMDPAPASVQTIASGDLVCTLPSGQQRWRVTESGKGIYLASAKGSSIFFIGMESDGSVPTLTAPVEVAQLPKGEKVLEVQSYLDFVVTVTTRGVRVAAVQTDGSLVYGPLIVEHDQTGDKDVVPTVGTWGSEIYVLLDEKVYKISLAESISQEDPLRFPYAVVRSHTGGLGALVWPTSTSTPRLLSWSATGAILAASDGSLASKGTLTTGYQRFGTLASKQYHSVLLRVDGTGGFVKVERIDANGFVQSLYTLDLAATGTDPISIGLKMDGSAESIALRFTLTPATDDDTVGPTLVGYQLRAVPAPQRQRLIRLPLLMFDVEQQRPGRARGRDGQAWERLSALEGMEASGSVFNFRDNRTGESARVYVEQVEHRGETPPGHRSSGFGGYTFITLRKLS